MKQKVFISYSRTDYLDVAGNPIKDSAVNQIVKTLKRNGVDVWLDKEDHHDETISEKIANRIEWADYIVFMSSTNSNQSVWVDREINYAFQVGKPIIPIRLDESPYSNKYKLLLANVNYIEYYKNSKLATDELLMLLKIDSQRLPDDETLKEKALSVLRKIGLCLAIAIGACLMFLSVGGMVGYCSNRVHGEEMLEDVLRQRRVLIKNSDVVVFAINDQTFEYDLAKNMINSQEKDKSYTSQKSVIERALVAVTLTYVVKRLMTGTKYVKGNGKASLVYYVVAGVGVACGYCYGEYIGEQYASDVNVKELQRYVTENPSVRQRFLEYIEVLR